MGMIYYFSATGNSYDVARDIAAKIGHAKLVSLVPLAGKTTVSAEETIGIVFPVYDWSIPPVVKDFLQGLDASQAKYIFAIATCNFLPGYSLDRVDQILREKGKRLNAGFVVRMPGTYLPMYGANRPGVKARKFSAKRKKTDRMASIVMDRRDHKIEHSLLLFDKLLGPKMETHMEHFAEMDGDFVVEDTCIGCGICAKVCHFDNITIIDGKPHWKHQCQQCFACIHLCPNECIQIGAKTKGKKRYHNPAVPLKDLIRLAEECK